MCKVYQTKIRWKTFLNNGTSDKSVKANQRQQIREKFKWVYTYFNFIFTTHVFQSKRILIINSRRMCTLLTVSLSIESKFIRPQIYWFRRRPCVSICTPASKQANNKKWKCMSLGYFYNWVLMFGKFSIFYRCTRRVLSINGTNNECSFNTQVQIAIYCKYQPVSQPAGQRIM